MLNDEEDEVTPPGFVFNPSDEELISCYLQTWVLGYSLPYEGVVERQVYGDNGTPWKVFPDDDPIWNNFVFGDKEGQQKKDTVFVITQVVSIGKNKISRTAGCGTWDGKAITQKVRNSTTGEIIGQKRQFTFSAKEGFELEAEDKGRWIMHEYSLPQEIKNKDNYVICRITRDKYSSIQQEQNQQHGNKRKLHEEEQHQDSSKKACTGDKVYNEEEEEEEDVWSIINELLEGCTDD